MTDKIYESFDDMNLKSELLRGIYAYGFEVPSQVQKRAIVPVISGKECIVQAQSGTGKTATFSISILQRVDEKDLNLQALVLSPTRELARQSGEVIKTFSKYMNIKILTCIGGRRNDQQNILPEEAQIIIGTPGRVYDLISREILDTSNLKIFVLDEADEMLSYEFKTQIYRLFQYFPETVQTAIYSATMPREIIDLTDKFMRDPVKILTKRENIALESLKQFYLELSQEIYKFETICDIYNILTVNQSIIFCNSKNKVIWLTEEMIKRNFTVSMIHGSLEQEERNAIVSEFRNGKTRVLITTDLLARGLDIHGVSLVINYDLPYDRENYIHRVGRTCRFGKNGVAINFVLPKDMRQLRTLEQYYNIKIDIMPENIQDYM